MNSFYEYFAAQQKMAAYRQAKRMQRGALTAQGGFSTTDPALRQTPFTIQCVIRPTKVTSTLQVAFNTKGDSTNPRVDLNRSGNIVIYGGGSMLYTKPANLDSIYDIVFVALGGAIVAPHMCFKMISRSRSDNSVIFSAFFTAILGWIYACVPSSNFVVRQS